MGARVAKNEAQIVFRCTAIECDELFVASYKQFPGSAEFRFLRAEPKSAMPVLFPETVREISPAFIQIYNQAMAADGQGLDQLVGIGLRKSLEFLVKDFATSQNPGQEDKIKALMLSPCITEYISDVSVKECAKRAAWLGNDETHYTRKWDDRDINDLKLLVQLTTNWIDSSILTSRYISEMQPTSR